MALIESGTLTQGVDVADFRLPAHTAFRVEMPAEALRRLFSDYHVLDSDGPHMFGAETWMLPAWPMIRIALADRPMKLQIGNRTYDPIPRAALFGTTTRTMRAITYGGVTVGASIGPLGWSRLFKVPADRFRDRIVPLDEAMKPALVEELIERLRASDLAHDVKPILDDFFLAHIGPANSDEPVIAALAALIHDDTVDDLATLVAAAEAVGISEDALRRLSARYFGFPPKTLLMRARFLRVVLPMLAAREVDYARAIPPYHDVPHFLRDANRFLSMTPKRFLAIEQDYLYATLRARRLVILADRAQRLGRQ